MLLYNNCDNRAAVSQQLTVGLANEFSEITADAEFCEAPLRNTFRAERC